MNTIAALVLLAALGAGYLFGLFSERERHNRNVSILKACLEEAIPKEVVKQSIAALKFDRHAKDRDAQMWNGALDTLQDDLHRWLAE